MGGGLERHEPEALEVRRRHHGERTGVERRQLVVVDAAQAVADDDQVGVEATCACACVSVGGHVEALARVAGADEEQVAAGARRAGRVAGGERGRVAGGRRGRVAGGRRPDRGGAAVGAGAPSTPGDTTVACTPHTARSSPATACESAVTAAAPRASARGRARRCQARS